MGGLDQRSTPIFDALKKYKRDRIVKFDVPGHKGGRGNKELTDYLGETCMVSDVNSMKPLDNLGHPVSVIKEAADLAAQAFGAANAFFMVSGTTSCVQAMVMYACKAGDKIIMPRNVHKSAINALVICGAVPVYVNPGVDNHLGIPLGMSVADVANAIKENPDAKAVLVNNPTYYGVCSDLKAITDLAHAHGMLMLVDEAHGAHFSFGNDLPVSAMKAGADIASVSMHKTGTSLTQSSFLVCGPAVNKDYMLQIINLTQTTSASYLLLISLDIARKNLYLNGREIFAKTVRLADYARDEINRLGGYYAFGKELINGDSFYAFDSTKLSIHTRDIGLAGIEVYDILRDEYDIQIEFGDIGNILAIISSGDRELEIERLISALAEIKRLYSKDKAGLLSHEYINPTVDLTPQEAFYANKISLPLDKCAGRVCGELVMCYPPGIPILAPGERITAEIIDYIRYCKRKGCLMMGPMDSSLETLGVVE